MGFENTPSATAAISPVPVSYPETVAWSEGFDSGVGGFTASAAGGTPSGNAGPARSAPYAMQTAVNNGSTADFVKTVTGLQVGRTYTLRGWIRVPSIASQTFGLGIVGLGGSSTAPAAVNTWYERQFTFTATADSHQVYLRYRRSGAAAFALWDDLTLTANPWTDAAGTVTLKASDGELTMDKGRVPFTSGSVTVPILDDTLAELLDPFASQRVKVVATDGTAPRTFDLALLAREVDHAEKTIELTVATDEALLQNYRKLTDDLSAFGLQSSLRAIINDVIGEVIPGRALEAGGAADVPFYTYTDATNMVPDPRVTNVATWAQANLSRAADTTFPGTQQGIGHNGIYMSSPASEDSYVEVSGPSPFGMQGGKTYVWSMTGSVRSAVGGAGISGRARRLVVIVTTGSGYYDLAASAPIPTTVESGALNPANEHRVSVEFTLPPNTTGVLLRAYLGHSSGAITWAMPRLTEKDVRPGVDNTVYLWGSKPSSTEYAYAWQGTADASASRRTALINRAPELLVWKAGTDAWSFLEPLLTAAKLRLWADEARAWRLYDPGAFDVPGRVIAQVSNTSKGTDTLDLDGGEYATGVIARFTWTDYSGQRKTQDDTAGTGPFVQLYEFDRPYPGPGTAALILQRNTGRKRSQTVTVGTQYGVTPGMEIGISLPGTDYQLGRLQAVRWRLTEGVMDLVSSGLVATPAGAINLLAGTIDSLAGTIDALS